MVAVSAPADARLAATRPVLLYTLTFGVGLAINHAHPQRLLPDAIAFGIGAVLLMAGGLLATWANRSVERSRLTRDARCPSDVVVVTGPFAFSRNPMHLARTLLYVGTALERNALWPLVTLIPLAAAMHFHVVRVEERLLEQHFGAAYRRYCARVRRWI
jgi:protein-S-isoprenylcysteine O-methyltransferase Ste14